MVILGKQLAMVIVEEHLNELTQACLLPNPL